MEIYKVEFKDKTSITVQADCVTEAINEAKYVLESQGITPAKIDSVWSLVYMDQEVSINIINDKTYKERCDEILLSRGKSGGTFIDAKGKTTEEVVDILNNLRLRFQKNEFKKAKSWLLEHKYPLDLIKGIIDFNIVDLANLMFEEENKTFYGKETRDLQDKT